MTTKTFYLKSAWIFSILLFSITSNNLKAQSFVVIDTDTTAFPDLRAILQINSEEPALETDFKVLDEDKNELSFSLTNEEGDSTISGERSIFILLEASQYTAEQPIRDFKKAVTRVIDRLSPSDKVNIGYFGAKTPDGKALTTLSTDFSSNFTLIQQDIDTKISASADSTAGQVDVFKGIYEALNYIEQQSIKGRKILIVITSATRNESSSYQRQDIVNKALKANIPIYTITYKTNNLYKPDDYMLISDESNAFSATARKAFEVRSKITDFLDAHPRTNNEFGKVYAIEFTTAMPADGQLHQYEIQYKGENQVVNYNAPAESKSDSFWSNYGIFIIIIVGAVLGVGVWQFIERRKLQAEEAEQEQAMQASLIAEAEQKKAQEKAQEEGKLKELEEQNIKLREQMRNLEQDFQKKQMQPPPQPQKPQKFDAKKTMISGGGGSPILMISSGGLSKNFPLNKSKITIGRNAANDIVIPEQTVSGNHAMITIENGSFFLTDVGSTNGSFVNGNRINKTILKSGDLIRLGAASCKFQL